MRIMRESVTRAIQKELSRIEKTENVTVLDNRFVDILTEANGNTIERTAARNPRKTEFVSR
jgi:hypothetical protein